MHKKRRNLQWKTSFFCVVECTYELVKSPSENPECNLEDHLVIWSSDLHSGFSGGVR